MDLTFDTLPEALILEICDYLDIFALVALSEVNRTFNTISRSCKAWWLHALAQSALFIPLPTHRPLRSYTAAELYLASHRAALTESNVNSPSPRLRSWRYITWPYEPSAGVELLSKAAQETAEDAIHMHLAHPNGNWIFCVSSQNVLRIIHLRSGRLALAYDGEIFDSNRDVSSLVAWAVEFKEEEEASLVMNCQFWLEEAQMWRPAIRLFHVHFDEEQCRATIEHAGRRLMNTMASHLDIAGGYIVAVENSKWPYDAGDVCLIRWQDMQSIPLPKLYPSTRIAAFQEYFVSVGISIDKTIGFSREDCIHLQVVGYPPTAETYTSDTPLASSKGDLIMLSMPSMPDHSTSKSITAASELAIHSYAIPFQGSLIYGGVPFSSFICHFYTGEPGNQIRLWIRPGRSGVWTVFPVQLDLASLRSSAVRLRTRRAYEGEMLRREFVVTDQEKQFVLEEKHLVHWAAPVASGRRFIWWRPVSQIPVAAGNPVEMPPNDDGDEPKERFRLFLSVIDDLSKMDEWDADIGLLLDSTQEYKEISAARQLRAARSLEIPSQLGYSTGPVYMFVMEEYSGTILVQLQSGNLWVLRYGKA